MSAYLMKNFNIDEMEVDARDCLNLVAGDSNKQTTAWVTLADNIEGKKFAIVFGWQDYDAENDKVDKFGGDGERICAKLAYLERTSLVSLYDDWKMPMTPDGNGVLDTEVGVYETDDIKSLVETMQKELNDYCKELMESRESLENDEIGEERD